MNLLTSAHRLRELRSVKPILATAALETRSLHLNYLSSELVIFSLFDIGVTVGEKEAMARTLLSFRHVPMQLKVCLIWRRRPRLCVF